MGGCNSKKKKKKPTTGASKPNNAELEAKNRKPKTGASKPNNAELEAKNRVSCVKLIKFSTESLHRILLALFSKIYINFSSFQANAKGFVGPNTIDEINNANAELEAKNRVSLQNYMYIYIPN
jgi:hypothetical protein